MFSIFRCWILSIRSKVNKRASILPPGEDEFDNVVVADSHIAASEALIRSMHVKEILKFKKSFLKRLKQEVEGAPQGVGTLCNHQGGRASGMRMYPRTMPGATLLLDRHYNSLTPYRRGESNIYAVRKDGDCIISYVETADRHLILRPHNPAYPIEVITLEDSQKPGDYIGGRVCHVGIET